MTRLDERESRNVRRESGAAEQESVWDYPRPPRLEATDREIRVVFAGEEIARTRGAYRVLETSHPPVYYIPPDDVRADVLAPGDGSSLCEWKGRARYWTLVAGGKRARGAAWSYPNPSSGYEAIRDHLAFYPSRMDACFVDGVRVEAQPGDFYGGWITPDVVGPFKGPPGTMGW